LGLSPRKLVRNCYNLVQKDYKEARENEAREDWNAFKALGNHFYLYPIKLP
jgi:hypothetical protein